MMDRKYPLERTAIIRVRFSLGEEADENMFPNSIEDGISHIGYFAEMESFEWDMASEQEIQVT